jgi:hypothetical protein
MPDCVVDATVVALANGDLAGRRPGNALDRRIAAIEQVANGTRRLRYNSRLYGEYGKLIKDYRNDVIETLFIILDDRRRSVFVKRNTLSRQNYATATRRCRWPSHDQHLLAAALGGNDPTIVVTEGRLGQCEHRILAFFNIHVEHIV